MADITILVSLKEQDIFLTPTTTSTKLPLRITKITCMQKLELYSFADGDHDKDHNSSTVRKV